MSANRVEEVLLTNRRRYVLLQVKNPIEFQRVDQVPLGEGLQDVRQVLYQISVLDLTRFHEDMEDLAYLRAKSLHHSV